MQFNNQKTLEAPFVSHVQIDNSDGAANPRFSYMEVFAVNFSITHGLHVRWANANLSPQDTSPISAILAK
jgi:hypothetical protein